MRAIFFILAMLAIGPLSIWLNDDLVSDFQLRNQTLTDAGIVTSDRRCTGLPVLFYRCGFKFELGGEIHTKNYLLFAFGSPTTINLLKNQETGVLTSSTGQEYFWNRVIVIFMFCAISFLTALSVLTAMFRTSAGARTTPRASPRHTPTVAPADFGNKKSFGRR